MADITYTARWPTSHTRLDGRHHIHGSMADITYTLTEHIPHTAR